MFWINRCLLPVYLLPLFFGGSFEQQWCSNTGYIENPSRCLDNGGQYISTFHCLFEMNEEEEKGYIVFNVSQPNCIISEVVTTFALDGGNYIEYNETKNAVVVSNRIDVDLPRNDGVWEFIEGSIGCLGDPQSQAFCFTIKLININDNLPNITLDEEVVEVKELAIQFSSCVITTLTIVDVDLGFEISKLYEIAEKDVPFGLILTKDLECTSELRSPGCQTGYGGNEDETKYSLIVTNPNEIDYETTPDYALTIRAWEGDGCTSEFNPTRSDIAVITVYVIDADDLPPEFESAMYTADVREAKVNVSLSVTPEIKAEDGDTLGADIEYSLVSDDLNSSCLNKLVMNKTSAVIAVIDEFVYEDQECTVQVQAIQVDNPQQSSKAPLIITILPANKACPTFSVESFSGVYVNGDSFVMNKELVILEMQVTDTDLVFEGNITVPSGSLYDVTDVMTEGQVTTFRLSPNEEPIIDNTTLEVSVSDDYLGCENSATVFVHLVIYDFVFDDQRVLVNEGDTEVAFDPPFLRTGVCSTYDIIDEFQGTFIVINERIRPKIVSDRPFDYERVKTYQVPITAFKGELAGGICMPTITNDTAIITIAVVDLNDETPILKVANTSGVLFEAVFFDVMGDEKIFNLANSASDFDASAKLAFALYSPDPSPLLYYRTDGSVLTGSSFDFLRNVDSTYDYTVNVTDTNTFVNDGWSTCPLKFGIMGWDHIFIFKGDFALSRQEDNNTEERPGEIVSICKEKGNIGWSLNENVFIKIDRILQDGGTYYIWVYGVNPVISQYLTKTDLNDTDLTELQEMIKLSCRFSNVEQSSRTIFDNYRHSGYISITFSSIILTGVISMIICLYSLNSNEESKTPQHEVEQKPGIANVDSSHFADVTDLPTQTESSQNNYDKKIWPDHNLHTIAEAAGANVIHHYEGVYSRNIEKSATETNKHKIDTLTHSDVGRSQEIIHNYFDQA